MLQAAELVVAFVFVDISVHVANSGLMVAAAVAFAVLAVTAHGPLGIFRICPPWLHLTLVISVAAVVAVAPVVPALRPDIEGIIVIEFGAIGLDPIGYPHRHAPVLPLPASAGVPPARPSVIDATATVTGDTGRPLDPGGARRPTAPSPTGAAARWAGRAAGTASASGRRAVAKHRPEAEKQVRRAIRGGRPARRHGSPPTPSRARPAPRPGDPPDG